MVSPHAVPGISERVTAEQFPQFLDGTPADLMTASREHRSVYARWGFVVHTPGGRWVLMMEPPPAPPKYVPITLDDPVYRQAAA